MPITYHKGDIFESGADILVNPVNCVGVMGKGLALQFKQRFPGMFQDYRDLCRQRVIRPGSIQVVRDGDPTNPIRIVLFPTKGHWTERSFIDNIERGLRNLVMYLVRLHPDASIAIPPLGCGLGGLKWTEVRPLIEEYLSDLPNDVMVYGAAPRKDA
jgi:O-acetyl-ADP-ribose deacetylase (regulator of RNase III)